MFRIRIFLRICRRHAGYDAAINVILRLRECDCHAFFGKLPAIIYNNAPQNASVSYRNLAEAARHRNLLWRGFNQNRAAALRIERLRCFSCPRGKSGAGGLLRPPGERKEMKRFRDSESGTGSLLPAHGSRCLEVPAHCCPCPAPAWRRPPMPLHRQRRH